jgi:hypothetical protein
MLSIFQTTIIGLLGSASAALLAANLLYFWRTNYTVDTVLHQFLRSVWLKQWFNFAAWEPLADIAAGTAVFFAVLLICALLLRAAAFLLRRNLLMFDAYSVAMWCMLPMVFLSPFGLVLYRIMEAPLLEAAAALTLAAFLVWVYSRLLKGAAIVLDSRPVFFYIAGYAIVAAGITVWLLLLDSSYETVAYLRYILDVWLYMYGLPA